MMMDEWDRMKGEMTIQRVKGEGRDETETMLVHASFGDHGGVFGRSGGKPSVHP